MIRTILALLALATFASAHQQPTTLVDLDVLGDRVAMTLHIPLPELELAFGHNVQDRPEQTVAQWEAPFRDYLLAHIHPTTPAGQAWTVQVVDLTIEKAEQTQSGPYQEVSVRLTLIPPPNADPRDFTLHYDLIMHQVVTHKAIVSAHGDHGPTQLGVIAVDTGSGHIDPLPIRLEERSSPTGFRRMISLGIDHIREGTDHLLFLLVLLLPATLTVKSRRWNGFAGAHASLVHVTKIVTAFTLGHSLTLLLGATRVLTLPQQPVEVLIATSILVTAAHAIRPIFPGREARIAAGFGLVHGLAFATVLAGLQLPIGALALSILGFNLGIELTQLFVIAITMPWLVLLSLTPAHRYVRVVGATLAAIASIGWIVNRISGQSNLVERWMTVFTGYSPLAVLVLALIAIPAYLRTSFINKGEPCN
jgi:hypothetical protein